MTKKIGVGIIGVQADRGWAALAHIPALRTVPDFEIVAVSSTRREGIDAAAKAHGVPNAYDNHHDLVNNPAVDLVVVTVKVPHHYDLVMSALAAGKDVYCEWPLGKTLAEANAMAAFAREKNARTVIGLQARLAPVMAYVHDLVREGYVGKVLSTTLVGSGVQWGAEIDTPNAYIFDKENGATMKSIPFSHPVDAVCWTLGEFQELKAVHALRRSDYKIVDTGEMRTKTSEDQIAVSGILDSGVFANFHYRGGLSRGVNLLWEINGTEGDLQVTGPSGHSQTTILKLAGARGEDKVVAPLQVPAKYRAADDNLPAGAINVAQMYINLAADYRDGRARCPNFEDGVKRHQMLEKIEASALSGAVRS